jgi:hypothetical protein
VAPDLFTLPEFVSYLQVPEFDTATAALARDLATAEIRFEVGATRYDALSDVTAFKRIALDLAKRSVTNPSGLRSTSIDDYSETYATESLAGGGLTQAEKDRIAEILGGTGAAFTVRAVAEPGYYGPLWPAGDRRDYCV